MKSTDKIFIYKADFEPVFEGSRSELENKFKVLKGKDDSQIKKWAKKQNATLEVNGMCLGNP
jgi:hypothetical protein